MKILLTGATGYIAKRLLPVLLSDGHEIFCCVRDKNRFDVKKFSTSNITIIEVDFLDKESLINIPNDIDIAFYLIHSMSITKGDFESLENISAVNFVEKIQNTNAKQIIYLSGILND